MTRFSRFVFGMALVAISLASSAATAADEKTDISGDWLFEVEIGGMQGAPEFTFKQEGENLTGKYKGQFGSADLKGTVKDGKIEFTFDLQGEAKVVYKGTIEKDGTMQGEADYAGQASGTWKGKKKPKE
jgi:hypothetical protein